MAIPTLTPASVTSKIILSASVDAADVESATLPFEIYKSSNNFLEGAADQVAYVYKKLGGDVLDIELTNEQVYTSYEESVLEYSYIVNIHQAKNSLSNLLGNTTASFDSDGEIQPGDSLENTNVELKYPRFTFQYSQRVADGLATESHIGGDLTVYSASFNTTASQPDYDLQAIIYTSSLNSDNPFYGKVGDRRITIRRVYYKTARAMWRFFAYYGGLNVIGNMSSYGQYSDDSTFEVVPTWQNKLQAIMYEDSIYTRISHYSYELYNNIIRLFPVPRDLQDENFWVQFTVEKDAWEEYEDRKRGTSGVNNLNTLPFANIPYDNINSIGKQWIRRFSLAVCKEMLGQVRSKFSTVPIPGESVTLNGPALITEGKGEQKDLRDELKTVLDELTYAKLAEQDAAVTENAMKANSRIALPIFVG